MSYRAIALAILTIAPACADSTFHLHIVPRTDLGPGKGQCDVRLQVDEEVQVTIRRDQAMIRNATVGKDARDDGSDCNIPLPDRDVRNFALQPVEGRGEVHLLEKPSVHNDFAAVLRIRGTSEGMGRYHFRLLWDAALPDPVKHPSNTRDDEDRPPVPPGFVWNNATTYRGHGTGESTVDDQPEELTTVRVDIDMAGKIVVAFTMRQPEGIHGKTRPLIFNGRLLAREGLNLRADMVTEDRRLHGTMTLVVDGRQSVNKLTLNATDGQTHLRLTWGSQ